VQSQVFLEKEIIIPWNLEGKYKINPFPPSPISYSCKTEI